MKLYIHKAAHLELWRVVKSGRPMLTRRTNTALISFQVHLLNVPTASLHRLSQQDHNYVSDVKEPASVTLIFQLHLDGVAEYS